MAIVKRKIGNLKPGKSYLINVRTKNPDLNIYSDSTSSIIVTMPKDATIPSDIKNLALYASFQNVMFTFDAISDVDFETFEYELYPDAAGVEDKTSSGFNPANVFTVAVPNSTDTVAKSYWGRVRGIDTTGNVGVWTALTQTDTDTPLIDSQYVSSLTASKITAGTIGSHEIILNGINSVLKSSNYLAADATSGGFGWKIDGAGGAVFNEASIRSKLDIGEDLGTTDETSFHVDVEGNMWSGANSANYATAPFRVANTGDITANSITLTGELELVSTGSDRGIIFLGAGNYNSLDTGFYVDSDGFFSLKDKLVWDGTGLFISGTIRLVDGSLAINQDDADESAATAVDEFGDAIYTDGFLGGLTINSTQMYYGTGNFKNADTAFYVAKNGGQANFSLGDKFSWDSSTSTLVISGTVVITSGSTLDAINEAQDDANNAQSSANNAQNTANGKINIGGAAQDVNLNAVTIDGGKLTAGSISTNQINANYVYAGTINANNIDAGTLSGHLISGGRIVIGDFSCNTDGSILTRNIEIQTGLRYRCTGTFGSSGSGVSAVVNTIGSSQQLTSPSSKREYKYNIGNIPNALNILKSVRPRIFNWKIDVFDKLDPWTDEPWTQAAKDINDFNTSYGFIAEEMAEDQPCLAVLYPPPSDLPDNQRTDIYDFSTWEPIMWKQMDFVALLVKAVQELSARVEELESR